MSFEAVEAFLDVAVKVQHNKVFKKHSEGSFSCGSVGQPAGSLQTNTPLIEAFKATNPYLPPSYWLVYACVQAGFSWVSVPFSIQKNNNRTVADRRAAIVQRHPARRHRASILRAAPSANNNRAGPVPPVGPVVQLSRFHFWHRARPAGRRRCSQGDAAAAGADTSSTGFCASDPGLTPTGPNGCRNIFGDPRPGFDKLSAFLSPLRRGSSLFIIMVQLKFEVGMNICCLHKSLWKTCRGLCLFDVHQGVIYDRLRADTCIRLLSQPPTVLSLLHLQSSGQLK